VPLGGLRVWRLHVAASCLSLSEVRLMSPAAAATLALLTSIRDSLEDAGLSPFAVTWGPWFAEAYYAV
jgi:hypothetical protein